jgi:cytidine deaminase
MMDVSLLVAMLKTLAMVLACVPNVVLVSNLCSSGGGRLIAIVCVDGQGDFLAPCGRCRQLLFEHGGPEALLMTDDGPQKMSAMLPWAFGPEDLDRNER